MTPKYKINIIKPKKGKGSFKRKKKNNFKVSHQSAELLLMTFQLPLFKHSFIVILFTCPCKKPAANRSPEAPVKSTILSPCFIPHSTTSFLLIANAPFITSC